MIPILLKILNGSDAIVEYEYVVCVSDLINHEVVQSMENYTQHGDTSCLAHCLFVSYTAYRICKLMGLDYCSAARGGLLHDFFLYDWHENNQNEGLHGFSHPGIALRNAERYFYLNELEREIIRKHMWPLTVIPPKHTESYVVLMVDKYCAFMETAGFENEHLVSTVCRGGD